MNVADAIVVGGGPAGSTCAWKLKDAGLDVVVLDRQEFPRTKLCAGWVTPEAIADLELDWHDYPRSIMTFEELQLHWKALSVKLKSWQHSIRRRAHTSRWAGDDVTFLPREGLQEMPPMPAELRSGDALDSDLWPRIIG